jgi:cell division protein FtsB
MLVESNPSVYVSGIIGMAMAPYAVIQQQKLTQCEALKQTNERLGEEVTILKEENVRLQSTVQDLETSVMQ